MSRTLRSLIPFICCLVVPDGIWAQGGIETVVAALEHSRAVADTAEIALDLASPVGAEQVAAVAKAAGVKTSRLESFVRCRPTVVRRCQTIGDAAVLVTIHENHVHESTAEVLLEHMSVTHRRDESPLDRQVVKVHLVREGGSWVIKRVEKKAIT